MKNFAKPLKLSTSFSAISVPFNSLFKVLFIVYIERAKRAHFSTYQIFYQGGQNIETSMSHISISCGAKNTNQSGICTVRGVLQCCILGFGTAGPEQKIIFFIRNLKVPKRGGSPTLRIHIFFFKVDINYRLGPFLACIGGINLHYSKHSSL